MKKERIVNRFAILGIVLALVLSLLLVYAPDVFPIESSSVSLGYETKLFDKTKVMTIDIQMPEGDFDSMLENALSETYYPCDIVINGTIFHNVGIRPKGNTSLTQVASDETTDRFSFKVEFDHYNSTQTCYGLDKLALNNLISDATYMKEYLSYDILSYLGVPSSLYSYASITVNGEPWGLYLALECIEESFALRNFGNSYGQLYKPDSYGVGAMGNGVENMQGNENQGGFPNRNRNDNNTDDTTGNKETIGNNGNVAKTNEIAEISGTIGNNNETAGNNGTVVNGEIAGNSETVVNGETAGNNGTVVNGEIAGINETANNGTLANDGTTVNGPNQEMMFDFGGMGQKGGMNRTSDSDLIYIDDDVDSYSTIFSSALFKNSKADKKRVITALKNISEGNDLESYMDVDAMLRYIAANVFLVNDDSYFATMAHNYYLYESKGKLSMLPWDYNLSFGGFQGSNATDLVNRAVDTVVYGTTLENRPMIGKLLEVDAYKEQYHAYLDELISGYFESGHFEDTVTSIRTLIDDYVKNDATAFYNYNEYVTANENLLAFCNLRAQSIRGQLDGTIPSTEEEQKNSDALIDASNVSISAMGTQGGNRDGGFGNMQFPNQSPNQNNDQASTPNTGENGTNQTAPDTSENGTSQMTPPSGNEDGTSQMTPPSGNENGINQMTPPSGNENGLNQMTPPDQNTDMMWGNGQGKQNPFNKGNGQTQTEQGLTIQNILIFLSYLGVIILATILVIFYKRRKYHT